jgi:hypothetical protein
LQTQKIHTEYLSHVFTQKGLGFSKETMSKKAQPQFWPMISPLQAGKEHGMPVVADLVQIVGDNPVTIGDADRVWEATFNTEGAGIGEHRFSDLQFT